jgi:NitT/TauT family transport system substrate-binding protein
MLDTSSFQPTRRDVLGGLAGVAAFGFSPISRASTLDRLTVWGMPATPSVVLARAVASGALASFAATDFKVWKTDDQMRAGVVSGDIKLFGTTSYTAANLYNRGGGVHLVNVLTWGLLYVMTARGAAVGRVEDLAGKTVLLAAKNDAPDLLTRLVLRWAGLDPDKDVTLSYVGTSAEAVPLFLAGKADIAVLPEPAATTAEIRAAKDGVDVRRALDITEIYSTHTGRHAGIPQAGLAVTAAFLDEHADLVAALHAASVEAGVWVAANPAAAGALGAEALGLPAPVIEKSLPRFRLAVRSAAEARSDLELYFDTLMSMSPDIVGGHRPDAAFYWGG